MQRPRPVFLRIKGFNVQRPLLPQARSAALHRRLNRIPPRTHRAPPHLAKRHTSKPAIQSCYTFARHKCSSPSQDPITGPHPEPYKESPSREAPAKEPKASRVAAKQPNEPGPFVTAATNPTHNQLSHSFPRSIPGQYYFKSKPVTATNKDILPPP